MNINLQEPSNPNPKTHGNENEEEDGAFMHAMKIINLPVLPMILRAAFKMGIIDRIFAAGEGSWLSPAEIAARLPVKPSNPHAPMLMDRMLRSLASYSILKCRTVRTGETESRVYGAEPICKFFLKDIKGDSGSLVSLFILHHCDVVMNSWKHLKDRILEGRDAFAGADDMRVYEYMGTDGPFRGLFNRSMAESVAVIIKKVLEVYRGFEDVNTLVDVGGGFGTVLSIITSKYPRINGINFDLANGLENAPSYPGVTHVAGNMFQEIPKGDAIFMNRILHSWKDEDFVKILRNCWEALSEKGKVILIETVVSDKPSSGNGDDDDSFSNVVFDFDMLMLSQTSGGRERTRTEFEGLAISSGFGHCEFVCRVSPFTVIEFHKASKS